LLRCTTPSFHITESSFLHAKSTDPHVFFRVSESPITLATGERGRRRYMEFGEKIVAKARMPCDAGVNPPDVHFEELP
jgi:hypothetical protein